MAAKKATKSITESFTQPDFNSTKFGQVLHYLINQIGSRATVGRTVLNKVLFYCDSRYYEKTEEFLTGEHYIKLEYGPVAEHFGTTIKELIKQGKITETMIRENGKIVHYRYNSLQEPELKHLNAEELDMINRVMRELGEMNKDQVTNYSHNDIAFKATKERELIDYRLVFYRTAPFSVVDTNE